MRLASGSAMKAVFRLLVVFLLFAGCATAEPPPPRTVGEFADDTVLTARIKAAIAREVGAAAAVAINVQTYRGIVQLSGFVDSLDQAQRAAAVAGQIDGVRQVANDVRLKTAP
jgi:hyperosmotically inducible periplasmic protein